jgi:hypothetical protein
MAKKDPKIKKALPAKKEKASTIPSKIEEEIPASKERQSTQAQQEQILPPKIIEVGDDGRIIGVQEKVVVALQNKRLLPHEIVLALESLLVRVANLEAEFKAIKNKHIESI